MENNVVRQEIYGCLPYPDADTTTEDNNALYRDLLEHKATLGGHINYEQHIVHKGQGQGLCRINIFPIASSTASSIDSKNTSKPNKRSPDYLHQILEPRGIKIMPETIDANGVDSLSLPSNSELAQALGGAYVDYDANLLEKASQIAQALYKEAQWTCEVYHPYFLCTNILPINHGVKRMALHGYTWSGTRQNISLPPAMDSDRRKSGMRVYPPGSVWFAPKHNKTDTHWPDHSYFIVPESRHEQKIIRKYSTLPAFRGGLSEHSVIISGPPYLLTEEKSSLEYEVEARQYLALIGASLLQDRLLLRHLTDEAQQKSEIRFDESLCVYLLTNCGPVSTVYEIKIRNPNPQIKNLEPEDKASAKKPVRFDVRKLYCFNLTDASDCEDLKKCVNFIHWWGLTVHNPAVMAEGFEASQGNCMRDGWKGSLSEIAFYYTSSGIGFRASGLDKMIEPTPTGETTHKADSLVIGETPVLPTNPTKVPTKSYAKFTQSSYNKYTANGSGSNTTKSKAPKKSIEPPLNVMPLRRSSRKRPVKKLMEGRCHIEAIGRLARAWVITLVSLTRALFVRGLYLVSENPLLVAGANLEAATAGHVMFTFFAVLSFFEKAINTSCTVFENFIPFCGAIHFPNCRWYCFIMHLSYDCSWALPL